MIHRGLPILCISSVLLDRGARSSLSPPSSFRGQHMSSCLARASCMWIGRHVSVSRRKLFTSGCRAVGEGRPSVEPPDVRELARLAQIGVTDEEVRAVRLTAQGGGRCHRCPRVPPAPSHPTDLMFAPTG